MPDNERRGGVCEIINEAMKKTVREQEEFPAKGVKRGRKREWVLGEERTRSTQAASGKCLAFVVG